MKFARAATGRPRLISCDSELPRRHARAAVAGRRRVLQGGLRPAAARLRARPVRRPRSASRRSCARSDVAAFIVEPIQGRMVTLPPAGYLQGAQELCRRYGTLFVARRDPDRARAHRQVVRARALGPRAGLRARRQGAQRRLHAGRRDGHHAARSTSRPWARSSAPTCTSRPTGATACRWRPAWRRCGSSSATASSSTPRAIGAVLRDGLAELAAALRDDQGGPRQRADDRDRAGRAERARGAAELAPDPHGQRGAVPAADRDPAAPRPRRDHDGRRQERRDQAAAAADALRGGGAAASSSALDAVLADCHGSCGQELGGRARHRHRDAAPPGARERAGDGAVRGTPVDPRAATSAWSPARPGSSAGAWRSGSSQRGLPGALPGARRAATPRCWRSSTSRSPSATSRAPARCARRGRAASYVFHCGALVSDWATDAGDRARSTSAGTRNLLDGLRSRRRCGASSTSAPPTSTATPARAAIDETLRVDALPQLVRADQAATPRPRSAASKRRARAGDRDPAPGDRLRARLDARSSARSRGRSAAATCCCRPRPRRSPASATSRT